MTNTNTNTVNINDVRKLREEAAQAGDLELVALCELAVEGDETALEVIAKVITTARDRARSTGCVEDEDGY